VPKYLIKLTPQEPWFFGGERVFSHPDSVRKGAPKYFIRSNDTPSQTTLFGALRYLLHGTKDWEPDENVGLNSYHLTGPKQKFGLIKGISPLYLMSSEEDFYIPAPMDHKNGEPTYTPYKDKDYDEYTTNHDKRWYPVNYDGKNTFDGGWLCLTDSKVYTELFQSVEQIGIDVRESAFFKRECKQFKRYEETPDGKRVPLKPLCFAFFADIDIKEPFAPQLVFLGQGRRAFTATCEEKEEPDVLPVFRHNIAYAQSPIYVNDMHALYGCCEFISAKPLRFRKFTTNYDSGKRYTLDKLSQLIAPGSVFRLHDQKKFKNMIENGQAQIAGFNQVIYGKELSE